MTLKEILLRFASKFGSTGLCEKCGISFAYRDSMDAIYYSSRSSVSPLCQPCYEESTAQEVAQYFKQMWVDNWEKDPDVDAWETFEQNVRGDKDDTRDKR